MVHEIIFYGMGMMIFPVPEFISSRKRIYVIPLHSDLCSIHQIIIITSENIEGNETKFNFFRFCKE